MIKSRQMETENRLKQQNDKLKKATQPEAKYYNHKHRKLVWIEAAKVTLC